MIVPVHRGMEKCILQVYSYGPIALAKNLAHLLERSHMKLFVFIHIFVQGLEIHHRFPLPFWHQKDIGEEALAVLLNDFYGSFYEQ